jgi:Mg2+/Co2+ transporter CorB
MNKNQNSSNLSGKSREELKTIAKEIHLKDYNNITNKELINLIEFKDNQIYQLYNLSRPELKKIDKNYQIKNYNILDNKQLWFMWKNE